MRASDRIKQLLKSTVIRFILITGLLLGIVSILEIFSVKNGQNNPALFNVTNITNTIPTPEVPQNINTTAPSGDLEFSNAVQDFYTSHPWYQKLPIDTSEYTIIFDITKGAFRIRLKINANSSQSLKDSLTQKALQSIESIGADPTNYYVVYQNQ
jgi:hypothetical protein